MKTEINQGAAVEMVSCAVVLRDVQKIRAVNDNGGPLELCCRASGGRCGCDWMAESVVPPGWVADVRDDDNGNPDPDLEPWSYTRADGLAYVALLVAGGWTACVRTRPLDAPSGVLSRSVDSGWVDAGEPTATAEAAMRQADAALPSSRAMTCEGS